MVSNSQKLNDKLTKLVREVWREFVELEKCDDEHMVTIKDKKIKKTIKKKISEIVIPTMPVLYFGDYNAYRKSEIKIVTVSLNPSDMEFKKNKDDNEYWFSRFPSAEDLYGKDSLNDEDVEKYFDSINSYFKVDPYKKWFDDNRRLLFETLDASYYLNEKEIENNVPLHIDLATAIATSPTWGNLSKEAKQIFIARDKGKWRELLKILSPDIMLLSLDTKYVKEVDNELFEKLLENLVIYQEEGNRRRKKYLTCEFSLENGKNIKVMDIITANKAFQFTENGVGYKKFVEILSKWKEEILCQK